MPISHCGLSHCVIPLALTRLHARSGAQGPSGSHLTQACSGVWWWQALGASASICTLAKLRQQGLTSCLVGLRCSCVAECQSTLDASGLPLTNAGGASNRLHTLLFSFLFFSSPEGCAQASGGGRQGRGRAASPTLACSEGLMTSATRGVMCQSLCTRACMGCGCGVWLQCALRGLQYAGSGIRSGMAASAHVQ